MPQVTKGGKYIFGWSRIKNDLSIQFPQAAIDEYSITLEGKVFLISGSKKTGGFARIDGIGNSLLHRVSNSLSFYKMHGLLI